MSRYDDIQDDGVHEITTIYTPYAQTYYDYNGRLPYDDDAAEHIRLPRAYTVVS